MNDRCQQSTYTERKFYKEKSYGCLKWGTATAYPSNVWMINVIIISYMIFDMLTSVNWMHEIKHGAISNFECANAVGRKPENSMTTTSTYNAMDFRAFLNWKKHFLALRSETRGWMLNLIHEHYRCREGRIYSQGILHTSTRQKRHMLQSNLFLMWISNILFFHPLYFARTVDEDEHGQLPNLQDHTVAQ